MTFNKTDNSSIKSWPLHGWFGIILVISFWTLNWSLDGLRTHWTFFPLWLGYCLSIDALTVWRKGNSLLTRNYRAYVALFFISVPVWWLFELLNLSTQNWFYDGRQFFTDVEYALLASLNFSTVMPAVFGTAELVASFKRNSQRHTGFKLEATQSKLVGFFIAGWMMLALLLSWPGYFFVFMWLSVFFILEPVNYWLGYRSLLNNFSRGDWRVLLALWMAGLICGFFWEMWNYYSYPKWIYDVPFVGFWHIFEMPLIGYLGYLPFSLELYAVYHFITGLAGISKTDDFADLS